jgi:serine/threonine protein kinase
MTPERQLQAMALLEEALDYPTNERLAFVQTACGADEILRLEVESLLRSREQVTTRFLQTGVLAREAAHVLSTPATDLAGLTLNHFTLLERLGSGGMGEVYLAQDRQLGRKVALKLLPPQALQNDVSLRRFAREARAASALNHPNIVQVYEIGHDGERHYIAAEYVAGQTLRARLQAAAKEPLPLEETLAITEQVAAALVAAHAAGIIHRDIKPENLMLRPDGVVKVLDFGIAKLIDRADTGEVVSQAGHLSTEHGLVMGTPGYMSPEQARGHSVTENTDLFGLGVILYEMLTGQLPFQGATKADFIARLLTAEPPDLQRQRPDLPGAYAMMLQRLLAKDPQERFTQATEVAAALAQLPRQAASGWERFAMQWLRKRTLATATALLAIAVAAFFAVQNFKQPAAIYDEWSDPARLKRTQIYSTKTGRDLSSPVFSPDGQWIAFDMSDDKVSHLYLLARQGGMAKQLTFGDWFDRNPLWSPDGQRLAFFSGRANGYGIWTLPRAGGEPQLLKKLNTNLVELVAWRHGENGEKFYYTVDHDLFVLNLADSASQKLNDLPGEPASLSSFALSPDGSKLIYKEVKEDTNSLRLRSLSDGQSVELLKSKSVIYSPQWFSDGERIAYCANAAGSTQPNVLTLANRQVTPLNFGLDDFDVVTIAPEGKAVLGRSQNQFANVYQVDWQGREKALTSEIGQQQLPMLSPDNSRLLYHATGGLLRREDVLQEKHLVAGGETKKLATNARAAQWSPDGQWLALIRSTSTDYDLVSVKADGTGEQLLVKGILPPRLHPIPFYILSYEFTWSPDSQRLVYVSQENQQPRLMQIGADGQSAKSLLTPAQEQSDFFSSPIFSRNGERLSFINSTRASGKRSRQMAVLDKGNLFILRETNRFLHSLGWHNENNTLLIAETEEVPGNAVQDAQVLQCSMESARCEPLIPLEKVFLPSLQLSPDARTLAFVTLINGSNNIVTYSLVTGQRRQLTNNTDTGIYYAGLRWMPNGQGLLFSKQTNFEVLTLIEPR